MFNPSICLSLENAEAALEEGLRAIEAGKTNFNFSTVNQIDSAAVAILLAWQRAAQEKGIQIAWLNAPDSLYSLAKLYGVHAMLQLKPEQGA